MRPKAKMNPLDKRIKPNPKYSKELTPLSLKVSIVLLKKEKKIINF